MFVMALCVLPTVHDHRIRRSQVRSGTNSAFGVVNGTLPLSINTEETSRVSTQM